MLILASSSPRRAELLSVLGIAFEQRSPDTDERAFVSPALAKAEAGAAPGDAILAADTEVLLDYERIGKPADEGDAMSMLRRLAGRAHVVRTELVVIGARGQRLRLAVRSRVWTKERDDDAFARYIATGEALGKAGAYNIHGRGGDLIRSYEGCYQNVVGLPLCYAYFALRKVGIVPPERPEPAFERRYGFRCPGWDHARWSCRWLWDGIEYESWR